MSEKTIRDQFKDAFEIFVYLTVVDLTMIHSNRFTRNKMHVFSGGLVFVVDKEETAEIQNTGN